MAEGESTSIAARIAALKLDQVGRQSNGASLPLRQANDGPAKPSKPTIPAKRPDLGGRPGSTGSHNSVNIPILGTHGTLSGDGFGNQPANGSANGTAIASIPYSNGAPVLPRRPATCDISQALPPRRPIEELVPTLPSRRPSGSPLLQPQAPSEHSLARKSSSESISSARSHVSAVSARTMASSKASASGQTYTVRAPAYDPMSMPPLPPKTQKEEIPRPSSTHSSLRISAVAEESTKEVPPALPSRGSGPERPGPILRPFPAGKPVLSLGFNNSATETMPPLPMRPASTSQVHNDPPPIPTSSRPDLTQLKASKPKIGVASAQIKNSCLRCRDFSAVDAHAARFPRQSIPSTDLGWLAHQLTSPFPSSTDKARAIFTWEHHNIDYDTVAFYSGNVKSSTPASTIASGLAVCEGYAGLFTALAMKAGLESVVVGGHGKGYGYAPTASGAPLPPFSAGHAWNAVKIDNNEWKLVDPCWGAGHVQGSNQPYKRAFSPHHFTKSNDDFGRTHFPADSTRFYRDDGRAAIPWDEYLLGDNNGEGPFVFGGYVAEEGVAETSFQPRAKRVALRGAALQPHVRFQFNKVCEHWNNERNGPGKPYCYVLQIGGVDGREGRYVPFESNAMFWWVDVKAAELGRAGQKVSIAAVTRFDDRDGRGVGAAEFRDKVGRVGIAFGYVCQWELVA